MTDVRSILTAIEYTDKAIDDNLKNGIRANWNTNDVLLAQRAWLLTKLLDAEPREEVDR